MFAINHAATALVIKKMYGTVPMIFILHDPHLGVELITPA